MGVWHSIVIGMAQAISNNNPIIIYENKRSTNKKPHNTQDVKRFTRLLNQYGTQGHEFYAYTCHLLKSIA